VKIFISYSRKDAGDFAEQIRKYFISFKHDVFTDIDSISAGDVWSTIIENNISNCDIFVVIVTYGALHSSHVDNEVLQAQREKKRIIPCLHRLLRRSEIKWSLDKIQGVEFDDKFELARNLYSKILKNKNGSPFSPVIQLPSTATSRNDINRNFDITPTSAPKIRNPNSQMPKKQNGMTKNLLRLGSRNFRTHHPGVDIPVSLCRGQ
jgi:hypothetical protein